MPSGKCSETTKRIGPLKSRTYNFGEKEEVQNQNQESRETSPYSWGLFQCNECKRTKGETER